MICTEKGSTLTGMSYMEQNRAGSEGEVGNVGPEFKPLETRGNKRMLFARHGATNKRIENSLLHNTVISLL